MFTTKIKKASELPISKQLLAVVYKKDYLLDVLDALYVGSAFTDYRRYHTLDHIDWCLKQMAIVEDEDIRHPLTSQEKSLRLELEMAVLFHDAVCIPGSKVNEFLSADIVAGFIHNTCDTRQLQTVWVTAMIRNSAPLDLPATYELTAAERIFRDIDHSILGSTWPTYERYHQNVRKEYLSTMMPEWVFNKGRIEFLTEMINRADKGRLFTTKRFSGLNGIAQINMIKERHYLEGLSRD